MCWLPLTLAIRMFSALWGTTEHPDFVGPKSPTITGLDRLFCFVFAYYILKLWLMLLWILPEDSWKSRLPHVFLVYSFLLHPPEHGDSRRLHKEIKTERSLPSFYTQSVFVSIASYSLMNTHTCTYTKTWKDPLIWRLWKYFLISWNYTFHWVMFKQQIGLASAFTDVFPLLGFEPFSLSDFLQFLEPCSRFCFCSSYLET